MSYYPSILNPEEDMKPIKGPLPFDTLEGPKDAAVKMAKRGAAVSWHVHGDPAAPDALEMPAPGRAVLIESEAHMHEAGGCHVVLTRTGAQSETTLRKSLAPSITWLVLRTKTT